MFGSEKFWKMVNRNFRRVTVLNGLKHMGGGRGEKLKIFKPQ